MLKRFPELLLRAGYGIWCTNNIYNKHNIYKVHNTYIKRYRPGAPECGSLSN
jgi:hypothetical protein